MLFVSSSGFAAPPLQNDFFPNDDFAAPTLSVQQVWRVSIASDGMQGNDLSRSPSISPAANGRYVAFESAASNLAPNDTNGFSDIFVHDRLTAQTTRISLATDGTQANNHSYAPVISADGRYVAFESLASNLVAGDTNDLRDIFVHDRQTGQTRRVSVASDGSQSNRLSNHVAISANGRYIAFRTSENLAVGDGNNLQDIYVHDQFTGQTELVSISATTGTAVGDSEAPSLSADGRYVAFQSLRSAVADDTNNSFDIFVRDRQTNQTTRVSVASDGTQGNGHSQSPSISADGRYVSFYSGASNLVPNDANNRDDVFVHDRQTAQTSRVSVSTAGIEGNGLSQASAISGDGRYVAFASVASNLVFADSNNVSDIFVHDRWSSTTIRVSISSNFTQATNISRAPSISEDGRYVAFESLASNLVLGDTNGTWDAFVVELSLAPETLATFNPNTGQASLLNTLSDLPLSNAYNNFSPGAPIQGQWVMGDWDGDGLDTPAVFANGAVYLTNDLGATNNWSAHWLGPNGTLVAGRFNPALNHDCVGVVEQTFLDPFTVFVLYYACDFSTVTPTVTWHWMSAALYDTAALPGLDGAWQFAIGDWDSDGAETPAIRRGPYVAFSNVPIVDPNFTGAPPFSPNNTGAEFAFAQYIGTPSGAEYGQFVTGDWSGNGIASFGLFYPTINHFYYYNNLDWVPGAPSLQRITNHIGEPRNVVSWRPVAGSLTAEMEQPLQSLGDVEVELETLQSLELDGENLQDLQPLD